MFKGTVQEFADKLGIEYVIAINLLKFLVMKGVAVEDGKRYPVGRGKPSTLFVVDNECILELFPAKTAAQTGYNLFIKGKQMNYLGNCTNIFDNGDCLLNIFDDASHFARLDELATTEHEFADESEGCGKLEEDEFLSFVQLPDFLVNKNLEFYYYNNGILVAYDGDADIHYFFGK